MVRDRDALSSIALLQERFRQLQKMRELRQERELMRTLSESARCGTTPPMTTVVRRSASCSGVSPPSPPRARPHCQLAMSLWPESQTKQVVESPPAAPAPLNLARFINLESSDNEIDTSLRL